MLVLFSLVWFMCSTVFSGSYSVDYIVNQVKEKKLPEYCMYMGVNHANRFERGDKLRSIYGPTWNHLHHFCWALVDARKGYPYQAIGNLDYVITRSAADFPLLPMVLLQKATILSVNNKYSDALEVYKEILNIKPDHEQAYLGMANIFIMQGDKKTAHVIVRQGLIHLPDSKKLKALLEK